ncbi:hypothetical protein JW998_06045 [candidate division KSB1 bacterium]|nr:hypothetical protein [candidate division KSB1 bacterium]
MTETNIANLFWTGGWDSTFRLLQLLLVERKKVQPYYLIDPDRPSLAMELRTMRDIKIKLFEQHPETREMLLATRFKHIADIEPNAMITENYEKICEKTALGCQYEWLARFAHEQRIQNLELAVGQPDGALYQILVPFVIRSPYSQNTFVLDEKFCGLAVYELFKAFALPLFNLSKMQMKKISQENGYCDLMSLTWFCHQPWKNRPCGVCRPCICTRGEGVGRSFPLASRLRYMFYIRLGMKANFHTLFHSVKKVGYFAGSLKSNKMHFQDIAEITTNG